MTFKPVEMTRVILCLSRRATCACCCCCGCVTILICYVSRHMSQQHTYLVIPHVPGRFSSIFTNFLLAAATVRYVPESSKKLVDIEPNRPGI
jgi:hypothetical protein